MTTTPHHRPVARPPRRTARMRARAQSTLEWVLGSAIILGTLAAAILAWNEGLASKISELVQQLTGH